MSRIKVPARALGFPLLRCLVPVCLVLPARPGDLLHHYRAPEPLVHPVHPVLLEPARRQVPWRCCLCPVQDCSDYIPPKPALRRKK